ncbi:MAG: hypothetical protein AABN95_00010 [Acidobacteriota bacterium]
MTHLTPRIPQKPILRSQVWRLALISLVLITLHATPTSAQQWQTNGNNISNTNTGNVGVGTTTPLDKLEVVGQVRVSGEIGGYVMTPRSGGGAHWVWYNPGAEGEARLFSSAGGVGDVMTIQNSGNVGIGTIAPLFKLHVAGAGKFTGNLIVDGNIAAKYQDVAEWVPASGQIPAGTVVVLDSTKSNHVIPSTRGYDTRVAGVISEQPGITLGERGDNKVLVATTGRVRIKVDATRGPIHIGDLLVTSDVPGLAMKSEAVNIGGVRLHRPGTLIGKALEPLAKGQGEILVLLSLQ